MQLIDMDSVKRSGDLSKVWQAAAFAGMPDDKVYSNRVLLEFDCKGVKFRELQATRYDMADAVLGQSTTAGDWRRWSRAP